MEDEMMVGFRLARWAAVALAMTMTVGGVRSAEAPATVSPATSLTLRVGVDPLPTRSVSEAIPAGLHVPEWVIKLREIAFNDAMRGGSSPLAVSKSRYGWEWLAQRHGIRGTGTLDRTSFQGPKELFERLDRNGDGILEAADFDWSERSPFVQQQAVILSLFNRLNTDGNGEISEQEWQALFKQTAGEQGTLTTDDLRRALFGANRSTVVPPTRLARLLGFFSGELGSFQEGPNPGQPAPDFTLRTEGGKRTIQLSEFRGHKPVVLIFGNFT